MRIFDEDVLQDLRLLNPVWEVLEIQEAADHDLTLSDLLFSVSRPILHFVEDVLKLSHASDFLVKEGAHQVFLRYCELVGLGDLIHIGLRLINLDEGFEDI